MIYRLFGIGTPPSVRPTPTGPSSPTSRGGVPSELSTRVDSLARGRETQGVLPTDTVRRMATDAKIYQGKLGKAEWREAAAEQAWTDMALVSGGMASTPLATLSVMLKKAERLANDSDRESATVVRYQAMHDFDVAVRSLPPNAMSKRKTAAVQNWRELFTRGVSAASAGALNSEQHRLMKSAMSTLMASVFAPQTLEHGVRNSPARVAEGGEQRPKLVALFERLNGKGVTVQSRYDKPTPHDVGYTLNLLQKSGKLDDRLLDALHEMANAPCDPRLDRDLMLSQTIVHLARPSRSMFQGRHGTCTAQTFTYSLAHSHPHAYVRMARDVMSPDGVIRLPSGETAPRVADSLFDDGSGRTDIERMLQSALMQKGRPQPYYNGLDAFISRYDSLKGSGLKPVQVALVATQAFKKPFTMWPMGEPGQGLHMIDRALKDKKAPLIGCLRWTDGGHAVLIDRVENGNVYYRNPQSGKLGLSLPLASGQRVKGDGFEYLPQREFEQRMMALVFPK